MTIKTLNIQNKLNSDMEISREVRTIIILISVFTASMIIGSGSVNLQQNSADIIKFTEYWIITRSDLNFLRIIIISFMTNFIFNLIIFISGFNCMGTPLNLILLIIKGLGYGYTAGYLFTQSAKGIGYYIINIVPANIIFITCIILNITYSIILSGDIRTCISENIKLNENSINNYIKKFIIINIIILFACIIEASTSKLYTYLFFF